MDVSIRIDDRELKQKLNSLDKAGKNLKPAFEDLGDELVSYYGGKVFTTQGQAIGERWRPLAASTVEARRKRQGYYKQAPTAVGKILIWTGRLRDGFKKKAKRAKLTISNPVKYFRYHQLGKRPVFKITTEVIAKVKLGINKYLSKQI